MVDHGTVIKIRPTHPLVHAGMVPRQAHHGDAGWDLYVVRKTVLKPGVPTDIPCGFDIAMADGVWARIAARSSTIRRHRCTVHEAVIDSGYRGPLFINVTNIRRRTEYTIEEGWRMAQLIVHRVVPATWVPVDHLDETPRNVGGFGSTGL